MHTVPCQEQAGCRCDIKMSIEPQFIFAHFKHFASVILPCFCAELYPDIHWCPNSNVWGQAGGRGKQAMLSNSQIIHSVVDIFGAGKRPTVKRMNVHNIVLLEVEQKMVFSLHILNYEHVCMDLEAWMHITLGNNKKKEVVALMVRESDS